MRLFLAVDLPTKVKKQVNSQLVSLKKEYPQLIWGEKKNYHITIYFFGEINKVESIKKKIDDLLYDQESFYLYATNCGIFIKNKIILYFNFRREKKIEDLADKIKNHFAPNGVGMKFIPHMTFARGKVPSKQQYFVLKKKLEKTEIDVSFKVSKLTLFESILDGKKTVYKKIIIFPLL